ncbi:MAG: hypothetical protein SRB1_02929 [Desulfobacteraceae bacterium Eth-SRB1]|nr:MAG: hypothetical protein SRB1_02929 [Desulfobacteraceae bacterium Eth-SRB1]
MIKDKKLIEGPGMTGKIQPIRPHNAKSNPEIINMIVKVVCPFVWFYKARAGPLSVPDHGSFQLQRALLIVKAVLLYQHIQADDLFATLLDLNHLGFETCNEVIKPNGQIHAIIPNALN